MGSNDERALAHAWVLRSRGAALPPGGLPPPEILDSWVRCSRAGLDLAASPPIQVVDGGDLARRRERAEVVRRLALAELETLCQQIAGSNFLLAFADPEGVVLDLYADNRFLTSGSATDIVTGSLWSEAQAGTNGLGTALATGRPVAVNGLEHFLFKYGDISCTAAPIRDAYGQVVGALDASSYFESRQRHTQALVQMACTQIEKLLLLHQMRERLVLAVHPRAEFLGTLSAGLLAFDAQGRLLAFNARARDLLSGLDVAPGTPFEQLFDALQCDGRCSLCPRAALRAFSNQCVDSRSERLCAYREVPCSGCVARPVLLSHRDERAQCPFGRLRAAAFQLLYEAHHVVEGRPRLGVHGSTIAERRHPEVGLVV